MSPTGPRTVAAERLRRDRALAALLGLAIGDALGMPTQELSRERAESLLAAGPRYLDGPPDNPISAGLPAGSVTDDTAQALVVARLLVGGAGRIRALDLATALLDWEAGMAATGSLDLLGPSTKRALEAVRDGADPATTGRTGTTNGAAMRITPVGIATPATDPDRFTAAVTAACRVTHDTAAARSGAAAVAAVVSFGVDGAGFDEAADAAIPVAHLASAPQDADPDDTDRGDADPDDTDRDDADPDDADRVAGRDVPDRIAAALAFGRAHRPSDGPPDASVLAAIADGFGTSLATRESVPAAFAVAALAPHHPWTVAWLAARLGGDADTIAAIATTMTAACTGTHTLPPQAVTGLRVDRDELVTLAEALLALRTAEDLR